MKALLTLLIAVAGLASCGGDSAPTGAGSSAAGDTAAASGPAPGAQPAAAASADNAKAYTACAACHLPTGDGVPGAFPPIRNRTADIARLAGGREYLITVVAYGLMGNITVNGQSYMGVMPGHAGAMSDLQIAQALNHTLFALNTDPVSDVEPFSEDEVGTQRAAVASPSPTSAMQMRGALVQQHGQAWP